MRPVEIMVSLWVLLHDDGIPATIVVPHVNGVEKNAAMRALGVKLLEHGDDFSTARAFAKKMAGEQSLQIMDLLIGC